MTAFNEVGSPVHGLPFTRLSPSLANVNDRLGPLADLLGTWVGSKGWNMVAVPFPAPFTLLVTPYLETITFSPIGAKVPNRRAGGIDFVLGVMYDCAISTCRRIRRFMSRTACCSCWIKLRKRVPSLVSRRSRTATAFWPSATGAA